MDSVTETYRALVRALAEPGPEYEAAALALRDLVAEHGLLRLLRRDLAKARAERNRLLLEEARAPRPTPAALRAELGRAGRHWFRLWTVFRDSLPDTDRQP
jgi:hypothetical protein